MPLNKNPSKEAIGGNIVKLKKENYPKKQAVAIALNTARHAGADIKPPKVSGKTLKKGYKKL